MTSKIVVNNIEADAGVSTVTVSDDVSIADKIVHTGDTNTAIRFPAADTISAETGGSERLRIDNVGTLLVAHTSQRNNFNSVASTEHAPIIQLEGVNQKRALSITAASNNDGGILMLGRQNGSVGSNTVVSSGDQIGRVDFQASGGTNMEVAAQITAEVDGTPGDNDMPGRLIFKTTADGASSSTERLRIDSSGHMGLGVTPNSNWPSNGDFRALQIGTGACVFGRGSGDEDRGGLAVNYYHTGSADKYIGNGHAAKIYLNDGNIDFDNAGANSSGANAAMTVNTRMRINSSGNIGVGVLSPDGRFHIMGGNLGGAGSVTADNNGNLLVLESNETNGMSLLNANDERANIWFGTTGTGGNQEAGIQYAHEAVSTTADRRAMIFRGGGGERMRLQDQRLLVGRTNNIQVGGDPSDSCFEQITNNGYALTIHADKSSQRALGVYYNTGRTPEAAFAFQIGSSWKTIIRGDGDLENANNSYGGISDVSMKENIVDANSQWNDIKNIKVRKFNYKAETGQQTHKQIGVIAQELETVSPKLVRESEGGMKTVSYSILYMKAIKALQEAQTRIETLESKVAALEGS